MLVGDWAYDPRFPFCRFVRRHQTRDFREHATSAPAEPGGEIHILLNRARTQVLLQARKFHVYGSGTFGAFDPTTTTTTTTTTLTSLINMISSISSSITNTQ